MKKIKLLIVMILSIVISVAVFAACGGDEDTNGPASSAVLESIAITAPPTKTEYWEGDKFEKAGMVVTATYDDGTSKAVDSYTYTPLGLLVLTDTEITISYTEGEVTKTAVQNITVSEAEEAPHILTKIAISSPPTKMTYNLGDVFDPTGLKVTATYDDGATAIIDNYTVFPSGVLGVNDTVVKVSYTEGEVTEAAYYNKKILIEAPELSPSDYIVAKELLFSDPSNYTLDGGATKGTWSSDGNTFDRLRCNRAADATITFAHDFSALADKSQAGMLAIMSNGRGGTKITISTDDKATWTTIAEAGEEMNMIPADYKYPSSKINDKTATDGTNRNVYYCYYDLGSYLDGTAGEVYIRFSYEDPSAKGWVGSDTEGSDLMHSLTFFNELDLSKISGSAALESIVVKTNPTKINYVMGETFDPAGLVLTATYSDESTKDITSGFTYAPTGALTVDDEKVTVSFTAFGITKTVDVNITVSAPSAQLESIAVTTPPTKTAYNEGDTFDNTGMIVTAYYDDESSVAIVNYEITPSVELTSDVTEVTIIYLGKQTTQAIIVKQTALKATDYDISSEVLFTEADSFTLVNNAYLGADRAFVGGGVAKRLRAGDKTGAYILFEHEFGSSVDIENAGIMIYALDSRMGTVISVSTDNEIFTPIAKVATGDTRVPADWKEHASNIISGGNTDSNLFKMYYNIGSYLGTSTKVYVKVGFEDPGWASYPSGTSKEGADIFGSITYFSRLDLSKVI